ncbi:hypothetical protein [Allokutzneria sp. NRRL B-24872]|uniref:terpene synthase family protein n=1 Tax=Allokutzneria sp. NRRL B-24872 TaxID=1137961 RepID=UPI000A3C213B|nr:hypothetical protein [Allokutzneria sp. NRRL B-24872]
MTHTESPSELHPWPEPDHPLLAITPVVSAHRAELERHILAWADDYDLLDDAQARAKLAGTRLGELVARSYPLIEPERLRAVAGWFTWAFVIDDCFDGDSLAGSDHDAVAGRMLLVLTPDASRAPATTRLDALLSEVWHGLAADRSPAWRMRFSLHMTHFLAAFKYESLNRGTGHTPELRGYAQLRRSSGGITPSLDLLEAATGREVPALLHETDQLRAMYNHAADVVVWVNDIVSLRKELVAGETTNGVLVLARERGGGLQDAVDAVYRRVAWHVEEFHRAEAELAAISDDWLGLGAAERAALADFTHGLRAWMRGNLDWSRGTHRYQVPDGVRLSTDTSLVRPPGARPGSGW